MIEPAELTVEDHAGVIATLTAPAAFRRHVVTLPSSPDGQREIRFRSSTAVPGPADTRDARCRAVPAAAGRHRGSGPRALLASRFPWLLRDPNELAFLAGYDTVLANSEYTRGWIRRLWQTDADVLFPPIQVDRLHPAGASRRRSCSPSAGSSSPASATPSDSWRWSGCSVRLVGDRQLDGWSMTCSAAARTPSGRTWKRCGRGGRPAGDDHANAPRALVERAMSTASHLLVRDRLRRGRRAGPWSQEHFGMTTAEAMAGGCVPVVIDRAGQREIVREDDDGFRWATPAELMAKTVRVATDEARCAPGCRRRRPPGAGLLRRGVRPRRWDVLTAKYSLVGP